MEVDGIRKEKQGCMGRGVNNTEKNTGR